MRFYEENKYIPFKNLSRYFRNKYLLQRNISVPVLQCFYVLLGAIYLFKHHDGSHRNHKQLMLMENSSRIW